MTPQHPFGKPGQFYRGNLHTHSTNSDGRLSPEAVCNFYRQSGYDFLVLSDHFLEELHWPLSDTRPYRTEHFTTLIGAEIHTAGMELGNGWHILAVGLPFDFAPTAPDETGPHLAQRALQSGAFVAAAHPQWFGMTETDMLSLEAVGVHAIEVFNGSCVDDNDTTDSLYLLDYMLMRGKHLTAIATDDAHFAVGIRDVMRGWVMVKAEQLTPEAILAALKAGDFYASTGPQIHNVVLDGNSLTVNCTPATRIYAVGRPTEVRTLGGNSMVDGTLNLDGWKSPYVRIVVRDDQGGRAWSNPIWLAE